MTFIILVADQTSFDVSAIKGIKRIPVENKSLQVGLEIEKLSDLEKVFGFHKFIVDFDTRSLGYPTITVYNDYVE